MKADDMAVKAGHAHSLTDESAGGDGLLDRMARRSVFALLSSLDGGSIRLEEAGATHRFGDPSLEDGIHATVVVVDSRVYRLLLLQHGSIGAGEAWMARQICSDSPEEIVTAVLGIYHGLFWPLWTELAAMVVTPGRLMFPEVDFRSVEA